MIIFFIEVADRKLSRSHQRALYPGDYYVTFASLHIFNTIKGVRTKRVRQYLECEACTKDTSLGRLLIDFFIPTHTHAH